MKLDFSALTQPTSKERGQVGTTGTQASMRVAASRTAGDTLGTSGDTAQRTLDSSVAVPAVCPPLSPPCPQSLGTCKPSVHAVSPVSPVVPTESGNCAARTGFADGTGTLPKSKTAAIPVTDRDGNAGTVTTAADIQNAEKEASPLPDARAQARRQRLLAMLAERLGTRYAVVVDNPDTDPVILALAIRDKGTCELRIPRTEFDPFLLLDLIERHGGTVH